LEGPLLFAVQRSKAHSNFIDNEFLITINANSSTNVLANQ